MTTWHVPEDVLDGYADGRTSPAVAASTEAHLLSCARCRAVLAPAVDTSRLDRIWDEVVQRVDAPRPGPIEALLLRLGLRNDSARLLAATPSLGWLHAVTRSVRRSRPASSGRSTPYQGSDAGRKGRAPGLRG